MQQRLALADLLPGLEQQRLDRTGDLQAQVDPLQGLEATDGGQAVLPGALAGLGRRHADRRLGDREHLHLLVNREGFVAPQDQYEQQDNT
ncbi:hypothetical protein D9M71_544230 [compost metagenome]